MTLQWTPLTDHFGAEVAGVALDAPFDDEIKRGLRALMSERSVLVFRGSEIAAADQKRLVELFGPLADEFEDGSYESLVSNVDGYLEDGRLLFHSDLTYSAHPYLYLSLYGQELIGPAAPTQFVGLASGYAALPGALRNRIAGLDNIHIAPWNVNGGLTKVRLDERIDDPLQHDYDSIDDYPRRRWPVVARHHRSGEPILFVSEANSHICGLSYPESEALLAEIFAHLYAPANLYVHQWRAHDLVVWDNYAVQHGRPRFAGRGATRTLRRIVSTEGGRSLPQIYQDGGSQIPRPMRALYPACVR